MTVHLSTRGMLWGMCGAGIVMVDCPCGRAWTRGDYPPSSSNNALASSRSAVPNPSVNQP
jgi:hypothetical protein